MMMTKRLVACLTVTALLGAGCKKKNQDAPATGGSASSVTGPSGSTGEPANVAPGAATGAAGAFAASVQQANAAAAKAFKAAPIADQMTKLDKLLDATIAEAQSEARDRSWDPASVIKLGAERAKLFAWVHDQTALVPYTGLLRGATGVMMDRVGNELDRSLLLAELLKQAGGEVRLAHATLDPANASKLADAWQKAPRAALPTTPEDPAAAANLEAALAAFGVDHGKGAAARTDIAKKAQAQVDIQAGELAKLVEATPAAAANDAAVFADHWWVQVKDGEAWTDLDLAESAPGTSLVAATETLGVADVPENLQHQIVIRVVGEVWHGAKREESTLVEHAFAPASYYGQRLVVTATPLDFDLTKVNAAKDRPAAVRAALIAQTEWIPMIVMGIAPVVHYSVTDRGELYDQMDPNAAATRAARAVQQATKNGVGGATDMLEGMPDGTEGSNQPAPKPAVAPHSGFTAEWIEIEVRTPNAPPRTIRRTVFDELAVADRASAKPTQLTDDAKLDRGLALFGETEVLAQFARIPSGMIAARLAKFLAAAKPTVLAVVRNDGKPAPDDAKVAYSQALPPPGELEDLAVSRFAWSTAPVFVDQLDVLTAWRRLQPVDGVLKSRKWFDIMTNGVRGWGPPQDARKARLAQGIADTVAESVLRPCVAGNGPCFRAPNTSDAFADSKGWAVTTAASSIAGMPAPAHVVAAKDLEGGYSLVVPPGGKVATWWRLRPETGEVLGEGALGGQEGVDYVSLMKGITIGVGLGVCEVTSSTLDQMTACAAAVAIGGSGLFAVGQTTAAACGLIAQLLAAGLALGMF